MKEKSKKKTEKMSEDKQISIKCFKKITGHGVEKFLKSRRAILGKLNITVRNRDWLEFENEASDCYRYPDGHQENYFYAILLDGTLLEAPTFYYGRTADRTYLSHVWRDSKRYYTVIKFIVELVDKQVPDEKDNGVFLRLYKLSPRFADMESLKEQVIEKVKATKRADIILTVAGDLSII